MSDKIINDYLKACDKFFKCLIEKNIIKDVDEEILFLDVENNLRKTVPTINIKRLAMSCRGTIKSGKNKGNPCSKQSFMNGYCKQHISDFEEEKKREEEEKLLNSNTLIIAKNQYNNFVFGRSGLIIRSAREKYVVAKEGKNGEWLPLSEEDIQTCKKFRLRYKIIDFTDERKEKTDQDFIKSIKFFDNTKEEPKMYDKNNIPSPRFFERLEEEDDNLEKIN